MRFFFWGVLQQTGEHVIVQRCRGQACASTLVEVRFFAEPTKLFIYNFYTQITDLIPNLHPAFSVCFSNPQLRRCLNSYFSNISISQFHLPEMRLRDPHSVRSWISARQPGARTPLALVTRRRGLESLQDFQPLIELCLSATRNWSFTDRQNEPSAGLQQL